MFRSNYDMSLQECGGLVAARLVVHWLSSELLLISGIQELDAAMWRVEEEEARRNELVVGIGGRGGEVDRETEGGRGGGQGVKMMKLANIENYTVPVSNC